MRWADLDLTTGVWTKPGSTTKQRTDHVVPLSRAAASAAVGHPRGAGRRPSEAAARRVGVPLRRGAAAGHRVTIKRDWARSARAAGITGLRVHDLRHSFASQLASSGHSLPLIGALLGHSNPNTTARYSHLFDDPMRAAVDSVGAIIENAGKPPPDVVPLPLKGRRRS